MSKSTANIKNGYTYEYESDCKCENCGKGGAMNLDGDRFCAECMPPHIKKIIDVLEYWRNKAKAIRST